MKFDAVGRGAFSGLRIELGPHESCSSEAGRLVRCSVGVDVEVALLSRGTGGLLGGTKRFLGGDAFFLATYRASGGGGEVFLAPELAGEVRVLELAVGEPWLCAGGAYLASGPEVELEARWQDGPGPVAGEGRFFLQASGAGPVGLGGFGAVREVALAGELLVDSGHVLAYEKALACTAGKAGSSWLPSFLAGERFVLRFEGRGRLLLQSHNPRRFGRRLGRELPSK